MKERVTKHEWGKGRERERDTESKRPPGSELLAQTLIQGLNSQTVKSRPEPKLDAQPTEHPGTPKPYNFFLKAPRPLTNAMKGGIH